MDYKILAKTLANRLKNVIKSLVHEDQNGYIKGRNTALVLRTLDDIIDHTNNKYLPGAIITLDYSRAFDTISKDFIQKMLNQFGFGDNFIHWVKVINTSTTSCINYNGNMSPNFDLERGIRQGCPFSPLIFILACEALSNKIRQSHSIHGIELPCEGGSKHVKFLQFADDSTLLVNDEESITNAFLVIEIFSRFSGLQLNRNKTEAIWLGCWKYRNRQVENINWKLYPDNRLKVLGVFLQNDKQIHEIPENWEAKFTKCQNIIRMWTHRNLTMLGRIVIAKTFLMSQFLYIMQATILHETVLKRINSLLFKYIWSKKDTDNEIEQNRITEKVKRTTMIQSYEKGGLNMIDIESMQDTFAISWIKKLGKDGNGSWRIIPKYYYSKLSPGLTVFKCSSSERKFKWIDREIPYVYKQILISWLKVSQTNGTFTVNNSAQVLWNNDKFTYKGTNLFMKNWINKKIMFLSDIIDDNNRISYQKVTTNMGDSGITRFQFNVIYNATKNYQNREICTIKDSNHYIFNKDIQQVNNKKIRKYLQCNKNKDMRNSWKTKFVNDGHIFEKMWNIIPDCTSEPKLILLQWKLLHNIYPTNRYLNVIGVENDKNCINCNVEDTINHFFYECNLVKHLWALVQHELSAKLEKQIVINKRDVILGYLEDDWKIINIYCIVAKHAINVYKKSIETQEALLTIYDREKLLRCL